MEEEGGPPRVLGAGLLTRNCRGSQKSTDKKSSLSKIGTLTATENWDERRPCKVERHHQGRPVHLQALAEGHYLPAFTYMTFPSLQSTFTFSPVSLGNRTYVKLSPHSAPMHLPFYDFYGNLQFFFLGTLYCS